MMDALLYFLAIMVPMGLIAVIVLANEQALKDEGTQGPATRYDGVHKIRNHQGK